MNGILNVYKEKGPTSHDVVDELRRILREKKAGHTGTLDPEAEGVLPVCLGKATKLSSMISDSGKTYRAVMRLGVTTDTQDIGGKVISESEPVAGEDEIRAAVYSFIGEYDQITPMYSARKVNGKKLYELAREGREVPRESKRVEISSISVDDISLPLVTMTVSCSKGTYIRTLCHDIGQKLGCGACMESLLRTRAGCFDVKDSLTLPQIEKLNESGLLYERVVAPDELFLKDPACRACSDDGDKLLHNGNPVPTKLVSADKADVRCKDVRMYDSGGSFIGIYRYVSDKAVYEPVRMLI